MNNFWNNNYIEYESNDDKNRNLSLDEYLNKILDHTYGIEQLVFKFLIHGKVS